MGDIQVYYQKNKYMSAVYPEVSAEEFYKAIFPLEGMEKKGDKTHRASNPIFSYVKTREEKDGKKRRFFQNEIVFSDHYTGSIEKTQKNNCALCSMVSYSGRNKTAKNAFKCHGFCIDLDGVGMKQLENFWGWVEHLEKIPYPTYVANSGHGLHIYYVFENPVPLYPQVREHLQNLKRGLTEWVWNKDTSSYAVKDRQYQGIYQGFRMVGSCTKLGRTMKTRSRYLVRVWKTGKPVSIEYLNGFVEDKYKCPVDPDYSSWDWADEEHKSLSECQELYPEWYERRIVRGEPSGQWKCSKGLYDWWLRKIQEPGAARDGNRYHCISMLYVYGIKCLLPKSLIDADAMNLIEPFNELTLHEGNAFTAEDVEAAAAFYDTKFSKMTRQEISRRTGITIEPTRRNGRKQDQHLKIARFTQELQNPNGEWRNKEGAPTKKEIVEKWRAENPSGKKAECIRETGLSKPTVLKWW